MKFTWLRTLCYKSFVPTFELPCPLGGKVDNTSRRKRSCKLYLSYNSGWLRVILRDRGDFQNEMRKAYFTIYMSRLFVEENITSLQK